MTAATIRLARAQLGFLHRRQLLEAGITLAEIRTLRRRRELSEFHRGVYLVGPMPPTRLGRCMAATLALEGAAVGAGHACELHGLIKEARGPIHLTRERGTSGTQLRGVVLHRHRQLPDGWQTERHGIPVVHPMLAIIQSGSRMGPKGIRRLLDRAEIERALDVIAFDRFLDALPNVRNRGRLRTAIDPFRQQLHDADRGLGTRFLRWCHESRLILPGTNIPIGIYEVDFHWAGTPLIVETDGFEAHRTRFAFDRDRERWSALAAKGYTVIVLTDRRLSNDPGGLLAEIVAVLERAGVSPWARPT